MSRPNKDYYAILGLEKNASQEQIKHAYHSLAKKNHPDKNISAANLEEIQNKFKDINEAYEVLSDPEKRRKYDQCKVFMTGNNFTQGQPGGFSYGVYSTRIFPKKVNEKLLNVTLEELYTGATKTIKLARQRFNGNVAFKDEEIIPIQLKKGWKDGTRLTYNGIGDVDHPGRQPADVVFKIITSKHPQFERENDNLIYRKDINLLEAMTGFSCIIPLLDDRTYTLQIQNITSCPYKKIIPNEGMPITKKLPHKGNLIVEFNVKFPEKITQADWTTLQNVLRHYF